MSPKSMTFFSPLQRIRILYALLLVICGLFVVRLFYLQIIRHDHYKSAALQGQLKEYEVPPQRGVIEAQNGSSTVPIVLNEIKYTLFADPAYIKDVDAVAIEIQKIVGGDAAKYAELMRADSRYVILAKKLNRDKKEPISKLELKGIGTREAVYRTYPQGTLAAQLLGFVNDEGSGTYGLEQALDDKLKGTPGQLRAITDARGVPLVANKENLVTEPKNGERVVLTIDVGMQRQLEDALKKGVKKALSSSGGAIIIEVKTGAIKAMANYPTYDPAEFSKIESKDVGVFQNGIVSSPLEVGSIMKPLTVAAAIDLGLINKNSTYQDPGGFDIDGAHIANPEGFGGTGPRTIEDILRRSLNTGATWLLTQMGGGEINEKARVTWHEYLSNRYQFGKLTGVEQGYESGGFVPDPKEGYGLNIQYANTSFGQGVSITPLQMAAALAGVLNDGNYNKPHLVAKTIAEDGTETIKKVETISNIVKPGTSRSVQDLMQRVFTNNHAIYGQPGLRPEFGVGGKTGTAEISKPGGGYYTDRYNGTFLGFVGGNRPEYVIVVRVNEPKIAGYAGSKAAAPIFVDLANMLIDNFGVSAKH